MMIMIIMPCSHFIFAPSFTKTPSLTTDTFHVSISVSIWDNNTHSMVYCTYQNRLHQYYLPLTIPLFPLFPVIWSDTWMMCFVLFLRLFAISIAYQFDIAMSYHATFRDVYKLIRCSHKIHPLPTPSLFIYTCEINVFQLYSHKVIWSQCAMNYASYRTSY